MVVGLLQFIGGKSEWSRGHFKKKSWKNHHKVNVSKSTTKTKYVNFYIFRTQATDENNILEEHGYISRFNDLKLFLKTSNDNTKFKYIHMQVNSKQSLPEDLKQVPIKDLPPSYQNPIFLCPNTIQLNVYNSREALADPINLNQLIDNCECSERIFLCMYPGGAACEVKLSKGSFRK